MSHVRVAATLTALVVALAACGDSAGVTTTIEPAPGTTGVEAPDRDAPRPTDTVVPPTTTPPPATVTTSATGEEGTVPDRSDSTLPEKTPETVPAAPPPIVGEVPQRFIEPVLADAAQRSGVAAGAIVVVRAQAIEWNDGSLGCPQPGQFYTQAIVPGYWVVADAGGRTLDYRLDDRGFFRLCEGPALPPPTGTPDS